MCIRDRKISKKQLKKNLTSNTPDEQHTTTTSEGYIDLPLEVEIPNTDATFRLGLMFRESLEQDKGMLFIFEEVGQHSFHMKNTRIPLDIAFVKEDGTIESIKELKPYSILPVYSDGEVLFAIEANRGWFTENNVEVGDEIVLGEAKDKKGKGSGTKDACYHKVKSRYSVWPSAYASGALVKCRKVGAANWGNKSEALEMPMTVTNADKKANTKAYQDYKAGKKSVKTGKPLYKAADHMKENSVIESELLVQDWKKDDIKFTEIEAVDIIKPEPLNPSDWRTDLGEMKRDEYGDPIGGPKISKKQKAKNLAANTPDEDHTTTTAEGASYGIFKGDGKPKGAMAGFAKKKPNPFGKRAKLKMIIKGISEKERSKAGVTSEAMNPAQQAAIAISKKQRMVDLMIAAKKKKKDMKEENLDEKCWKGYEKKGMKTMFGKRYPNCVKKKVGESMVNWREDLNIEEGAAWTKKSGKSASGGLNEKGRKSYERENPGSDLKAPSKKVGNPRRKSFCARMKGMKKKLTSAKTARDPDSRINKSLRAWNC